MTRNATLPLLNIQQYYDNPSAFVEKLRSACHNVGFFLLQHDIEPRLVQEQLDETRKFFQQPLEDKLSISYHNSPSFRGFMRIGVENTAGAVDLREQIEYAAVYAAKAQEKPWPVYERLKATENPWPHSFQPTLQTATEAYVPECRRIADCLRDALCLALGVGKEALDPLFGTTTTQQRPQQGEEEEDPPHWVLKLISYPVVQKAKDNDEDGNSFGVGAHCDTNFLTLVLQDDVGGLQVFSEGDWIDVPSRLGNNVLVCNLGEQAEILSGGYFRATPHRVLPNLNGSKARISVPLFYNPLLSATIEPIVARDHPLQWERADHDHWRRKQNTMLATVGDNTFKSLARSHPEVFAKHHDDLELFPDGSVKRKGGGGAPS